MVVAVKPLTLIIVDDEASVEFISRMKFRNAIRDGDMELHFFEKAQDCMDYLSGVSAAKHSEIILFTDINMPQISGYDLLSYIRVNFPELPAYVMSAYDDEVSVKKSMGLGARGYFTKPINYNEIKALLNREYGLSL